MSKKRKGICENKMNLAFFGCLILLLVVAVAGCTSDDSATVLNETNNSTIDESNIIKTYKDDYISFDYPGNYNIKTSSGYSSYLSIKGDMVSIEITNGTAEKSLSAEKYFEESVAKKQSYIDLERSEYININGINAIKVKRYNNLANQHHVIVIFIKNGIKYRLWFQGNYITSFGKPILFSKEYELILNSFKTFQ